MADKNNIASKKIRRRGALKAIGSVTTAAGLITATSPVAAEYPEPNNSSNHYGQLTGYESDTDEAASWDFKISLQNAITYNGSVIHEEPNERYVHQFDANMLVNAWQKRHEEDEWEHVDPDDGSNDRWQYLLDYGYFSVDIDGGSLSDYGTRDTDGFHPARGTNDRDGGELKDRVMDKIVSRAAQFIPGAGQVLDAYDLAQAVATDTSDYNPNPSEEPNYIKWQISFNSAASNPPQAAAWYDFMVITDQPCTEFDVTLDCEFEIENNGSDHRQLERVSETNIMNHTSGYKYYYKSDDNPDC